MKISKTLRVLLLLLILASSASFAQVREKPQKNNTKETLGLITNSDISANIQTQLGEDEINGRISMYLKMTPETLEKGVVEVEGLNLAFFGVNQNLISKGAKLEDPYGLLGMAVDRRKKQVLKLNAKRNRIEGSLQMFIDASVLNNVIIEENNSEKYQDEFITATIPANLKITIDLEKPIEGNIKEIDLTKAKINIELDGKSAEYDQLKFSEMRLVTNIITDYQILPLRWFEIGKSLCIQPVNLWKISIFPLSVDVTGEGLAFGEPQLRHEWRKNDVIFEIRNPINVFDASFYEFEETESTDLLNTVDVDDCIEVFFPHEFNPNDLFGGGACFGSGTASAKVVSSDENARMGIDFTHLAHEFGHVLGLRHPTSAATASAVPGNTGTLICPSGFANDNPEINSVEHESMISNPLLRFVFMPISSATPDCDNSADCGPCP